MNKLEKELDKFIKEKEYKGTPFIIPGLGKRESPGFKAVGSVFFVDINVKNKIIYFYLDCEFKIKPYFRFDQVLLLKYIDKKEMCDYEFDISNMIPFYYISFNNFTTTTIKAYIRNRKIIELEKSALEDNSNFEKQIIMYDNYLQETTVKRIFKELLHVSFFEMKKKIKKKYIKHNLKVIWKLWKFKNNWLWKRFSNKSEKKKQVIINFIRFIRIFLTKKKQNLRKRRLKKPIKNLIKTNSFLKKERSRLWNQKVWVHNKKILSRNRVLKDTKRFHFVKEKFKKRKIIKLLNFISKSSNKKLVKIFSKESEKKRKYVKVLMWFERKKEKLFNIAMSELVYSQEAHHSYDDRENLARFISKNAYGLYFKTYAYEMYKKFLKKQGIKYKIFAYINKKNKKVRYIKLGVKEKKKTRKLKWKFRKRKFVFRRDKSKLWNTIIFSNPLLFIERKLKKKIVRLKKKIVRLKLNKKLSSFKKSSFLRKVVYTLVKRRKIIKRKRSKMIKKKEAYWLKQQRKFKPWEERNRKRYKRRLLKNKFRKKKKLELFFSKKQEIMKIKTRPSFYTWILTFLINQWQWNNLRMAWGSPRYIKKVFKQKKKIRLKWFKSINGVRKRRKFKSKLKKVKLILKLLKKKPSKLFIKLFKKNNRTKKKSREKVKKQKVEDMKKNGSKKCSKRKFVNVSSFKNKKRYQNKKALKFQRILKKKKKIRISKRRMYPCIF